MSHAVAVALLLLHALCATLLVGALTHQVFALWWPASGTGNGWWHSLRAVHPQRYVAAIIVLYCATVTLGGIDYIPFRIGVRAEYLDIQVRWATGIFEMKEHAAALGLAVLPAYWAMWREPAGPGARLGLTTFLTLIVWWNFVVGHVVNNVRGL